MSQSITNKLIANIKQSRLNGDTNNFINSEDVICIDSSDNRIGINTRNPKFSIDISGRELNNGLKASYLVIDNSASINEISSNKIRINDELSSNKIDVSNLIFNELSGNIVYANTISADTIKISNLALPDISINDICVNNLTILDGFDCYADTAFFNNVTIGGLLNLTSGNTKQDNLTISNELIVDGSANINNLSFNNANGNYLYIIDLSVTNLDVSNNAKFASGIQVTGEASFNSINVDGSCNLTDLLINEQPLNEFVNDKINSKLDNPIDKSLTVINLNVQDKLKVTGGTNNFSQINNLEIYNKLNFIADSELILPNTGSTNRSIRFDEENDSLIVKKFFDDNSTLKDIVFNSSASTKFIVLEISNNNLRLENYNIISQTWSISGDSNSMIFSKGDSNTGNNTNYKKFDLVVNNSNVIDFCFNHNIVAFDKNDFSSNNSDILNIQANITLKLLNKNPGDIEVKNYGFGIYSYTSDDLSINNFAHELVCTTNTIMVFDSSYNYANSSLSYIYKTKTDATEALSGISFLIKQVDDLCLNNIIVDKFNATIIQS